MSKQVRGGNAEGETDPQKEDKTKQTKQREKKSKGNGATEDPHFISGRPNLTNETQHAVQIHTTHPPYSALLFLQPSSAAVVHLLHRPHGGPPIFSSTPTSLGDVDSQAVAVQVGLPPVLTNWSLLHSLRLHQHHYHHLHFHSPVDSVRAPAVAFPLVYRVMLRQIRCPHLVWGDFGRQLWGRLSRQRYCSRKGLRRRGLMLWDVRDRRRVEGRRWGLRRPD